LHYFGRLKPRSTETLLLEKRVLFSDLKPSCLIRLMLHSKCSSSGSSSAKRCNTLSTYFDKPLVMKPLRKMVYLIVDHVDLHFLISVCASNSVADSNILASLLACSFILFYWATRRAEELSTKLSSFIGEPLDGLAISPNEGLKRRLYCIAISNRILVPRYSGSQVSLMMVTPEAREGRKPATVLKTIKMLDFHMSTSATLDVRPLKIQWKRRKRALKLSTGETIGDIPVHCLYNNTMSDILLQETRWKLPITRFYLIPFHGCQKPQLSIF
ncbi:LOW QUALITY PROTEIN: hypothetical protein HID58_060814, partial [Brassica napus]